MTYVSNKSTQPVENEGLKLITFVNYLKLLALTYCKPEDFWGIQGTKETTCCLMKYLIIKGIPPLGYKIRIMMNKGNICTIALEMVLLRMGLGLFYIQTSFLFSSTVLDFTPFNIASVSATTFSNFTDRLSLLDLKSRIIHDPQNIFGSWNDSLHFCQWQGVRCGRRHERVTVLKLESSGLVSSISPALGNLSFLWGLDLSNNTLQGKISDELGRLFRLQILVLNNNSFVGEIPGNLSHCSKLEYLGLASNNLVGKIPAELVSLSKLEELVLHWNNLSGAIPPFIGNLTSLNSISAAGNNFQGRIPDTLGQLKNLESLGLGTNFLSGTVPLSIYNLSSLGILSLSENQLKGYLPSDIGLSLPNLQYIQIRANQFSGSIPLSISNSSQLQVLEAEQNRFSGKLSVNFGGLKHLAVVSLSFNKMGSGEPDELRLLNSLINCTSLYAIALIGNRFEGMLPNYLGNLSTRLTFLGLGQNQLFGGIPSGIGNLINLNILGLEFNQFSGPIPLEIGKLRMLQRFSLSHNRLSGHIPSSIGNLTLLLEFDLQSNQLQGTIPSSIGNCQKLLVLYLSRNNLSGNVPKELFTISALSISLDLSQNYFDGSLPSEIGSLKSLTKLNVSYNEFSGEIPSTLASCTSLQYLYMQHNFLQGSIPSSLSTFRGIQKLDLSHNNLSGQIPKFLETFPLLTLNLSFNDFKGEVPTKGAFGNATSVSVDGNKKLCGGISELKLPKCTFKKSKKRKIPLWLILLLSIACGFLGVAAVSFVLLCLSKRKRKEQSSELSLKEPLPKFSYEMLLKATNGFSSDNLIGEGGFGSVYRGILDQDETAVAIKVLNLQIRGASKSFVAECEALRNIRHRNLLKIITSCSSTDFQGNEFKALVYELMPNGSLEMWLHRNSEMDSHQDETQHLDLLRRINIAIDVASSLDYLHNHSHKPIIHCDLKPSNILLDSNMTAHVGDFGLARLSPELTNFSQSSSVGLKGTIGYAPPEYGLGSQVSIYGDIYSYGILLLEMITGKRPTDNMFEGTLNLHVFVRMAMPEQVLNIVDPSLLSSGNDSADNMSNMSLANPRSSRNEIGTFVECVTSLIEIGLSCSKESPQDRLEISHAITELCAIRKNLQ